jgi:membrane-associated protease RseP (regulator of RpoE activity)
MDLETLSVIVFFGILAIIIYLDRKNIEFKSGLMMRRTKKGKKFIYNFAEKHKKKLIVLGNIAIIVGVIASAFGFFMLVQSSYKFVLKPGEATQGIKLVFPSVSGVKMPGFVLGVPFWYWILGIFVVLFAHEPMHALLARAENVKIKSFGLLLFFILPGAFVDPDEKQIKKLSTLKKLRIYAAGSFGNLIAAGVFLLLIISYNFLIDSLMSTEGVVFEKTIEKTGASEVGLTGTILGINDKEVKSMTDFLNIMGDVNPGDTIKIKTTKGDFQVKITPNPDDSKKPFIGISKPSTLFIYNGFLKDFGVVPQNTLSVISWVLGLFNWIFILNIGIGTFNLFPIKPLDGGLMLEVAIKHYYKGKKVKYLVNGISLLTLLLVLINLFGPSIISLIKPLFV